MEDHDASPQVGTVYGWHGLASTCQSASDHPLSAVCRTCSRWLVKDTPSSPWRHRGDNEPPVTEPTSGGWLIMPTAMTESHAITPEVGSVTREKDGATASLMRPQDYPVRDVCLVCHGVIRCEGYMFGEWAPEIPNLV